MDPLTRNNNNNERTEGLPTYEEAIKMKPNIYIIQNEISRNIHDTSFPTQILNNTERPIFSRVNQGANSINSNMNYNDNFIGIPRSNISENSIPITGPSIFLNYPNYNFDSAELQNINSNQNSSDRNINFCEFFNFNRNDEEQVLLILIMSICCFFFSATSLIFYIFLYNISQKIHQIFIFASLTIFVFTVGFKIYTAFLYSRITTGKYKILNIILQVLTLLTSVLPALLYLESKIFDKIHRIH